MMIESHLLWNNIRIVGFQETTECSNPTEFVERWLLDMFGKEAVTPMYSVERVHRVPPRPLPPGHPPHTLLAQLLNFKDKEIVLRMARIQNPV